MIGTRAPYIYNTCTYIFFGIDRWMNHMRFSSTMNNVVEVPGSPSKHFRDAPMHHRCTITDLDFELALYDSQVGLPQFGQCHIHS